MKMIKSSAAGFEKLFQKLRFREGAHSPELLAAVAKIVDDVAASGDRALLKYMKKFDGYAPAAAELEATPAEKKKALAEVKPQEISIIKSAARRIERYHRCQVAHGYKIRPETGVELEQRILPLHRVGIYAPGGKASYPSTILMAAIPARIAGAEEIVLVSPAPAGKLNPYIAAAAEISGVHRIFKIGGAQAVAALAYGTETIPQVDKIVGPGNAYVAAAKKMVFGQVDIDMIAGPSEVVVIADAKANASFAAADMLAQIEHDEMAAAFLLTPSETFAITVYREIRRQIKTSARKKIIEKSLDRYCAIFITGSLDEAVNIANRFAPEHLELMTQSPDKILKKVRNAGSVFLGSYTPEALGDYLAGTNHILPTGGTARFSSPLGVYDFYKRMSVLSFSRKAFEKLSRPTADFARMEGLDAHAHSVLIRGK
ncbi:MAG TPA: histidinol dehydrogenase [Smithella sp.]|nr:histidinol dehydrogenase [Smithella sp.]